MTYGVLPSAITVAAVHVYGDLAIYLITLEGQRVPLTGGNPAPFESEYIDIPQRAPAGGWSFRYCLWSDNLPAPNRSPLPRV